MAEASHIAVPRKGRDRDFEEHRSYLYLLARSNISPRDRGRLDPSGLVQQTLLDAYQKQAQFRGTTTAELTAWLRQILTNNLADAVRGLARAKRDVSRERSADQASDSYARVDHWLTAVQSSPSQRAMRSEDLFRLAEAILELPELQREALVLHHLQELPLLEVSRHLQKTPAAVAGLLHRGLKRLRELLSAEDSRAAPDGSTHA